MKIVFQYNKFQKTIGSHQDVIVTRWDIKKISSNKEELPRQVKVGWIPSDGFLFTKKRIYKAQRKTFDDG